MCMPSDPSGSPPQPRGFAHQNHLQTGMPLLLKRPSAAAPRPRKRARGPTADHINEKRQCLVVPDQSAKPVKV